MHEILAFSKLAAEVILSHPCPAFTDLFHLSFCNRTPKRETQKRTAGSFIKETYD